MGNKRRGAGRGVGPAVFRTELDCLFGNSVRRQEACLYCCDLWTAGETELDCLHKLEHIDGVHLQRRLFCGRLEQLDCPKSRSKVPAVGEDSPRPRCRKGETACPKTCLTSVPSTNHIVSGVAFCRSLITSSTLFTLPSISHL